MPLYTTVYMSLGTDAEAVQRAPPTKSQRHRQPGLTLAGLDGANVLRADSLYSTLRDCFRLVYKSEHIQKPFTHSVVQLAGPLCKVKRRLRGGVRGCWRVSHQGTGRSAWSVGVPGAHSDTSSARENSRCLNWDGRAGTLYRPIDAACDCHVLSLRGVCGNCLFAAWLRVTSASRPRQNESRAAWIPEGGMRGHKAARDPCRHGAHCARASDRERAARMYYALRG